MCTCGQVKYVFCLFLKSIIIFQPCNFPRKNSTTKMKYVFTLTSINNKTFLFHSGSELRIYVIPKKKNIVSFCSQQQQKKFFSCIFVFTRKFLNWVHLFFFHYIASSSSHLHLSVRLFFFLWPMFACLYEVIQLLIKHLESEIILKWFLVCFLYFRLALATLSIFVKHF